MTVREGAVEGPLPGEAHRGGVLSLQDVVDALASRLEVSVTLEDAKMHLLVHSAHGPEVDQHRQGIILARQAPDWVQPWARAHGIYDAAGPVRIPGEPERELQARVAAPIRWQGHLLGWIFLLDPEESLDEEDLQLAAQAADHAALILSRSHRAEQHRRQLRSGVLTRLLGEDEVDRTRAARTVSQEGLLVEGPVRIVVADVESIDRQGVAATEDGLLKVADMLPEGEGHAMVLGAQVVLMAVARDPLVLDPIRLGQRIRVALDRVGLPVPVGIGSVAPALDQAVTSRRHAAMACLVAERVPGMGPVARWEELGAYRALLSLPAPWDPALLHPGIVAAGLDADGPELLETVEVYLDQCGKAGRAAALLHIHRGTLYYRLRRFSELTGCDLDDGADRLSAHLALKAMHLQG